MVRHLYEIVRHRAAQYPNAIALGSQEGTVWRTVDSRQLLALADTLAVELAALGIREGDRVMLWLPGAWRTPVYMFALWKLGAIVVPLDREVNHESVQRIISLVEPRRIITGFGESPAWATPEVTLEWWEPGSKGTRSAPEEPWRRPAEDVCAIFFTSGTTGKPKGCMITHANVISQIETMSDMVPVDPSCRLASVLPLAHLYEFTVGLLYPLYMGSEIHYVPNRRGPDLLRVLQAQRVTHMAAVPALLALTARGIEQQLRAKLPAPVYRLMSIVAERLPVPARRRLFKAVHERLGGHLVLMTSAGAALPYEVRRFWERLGVIIQEGYGASECSPIITAAKYDGSNPPGSVGKPIRGVSVQLSPEGEVLVKGPNVFKGYWRDPEATAAAFDPDGWYHTGDLGAFDAHGNLVLQGRLKEMIVLPSGKNVWPQDVEEVLQEDPVVKDAVVIPVRTGRLGLKLHAYLIRKPDTEASTVDLSTVVARANGRLAQHQRLATASWWPEADFPRTLLLKVKRHLIPPPEQGAASGGKTAKEADIAAGG